MGSTAAPPVAAAITLTGFIGLPTVPIPTVGLLVLCFGLLMLGRVLALLKLHLQLEPSHLQDSLVYNCPCTDGRSASTLNEQPSGSPDSSVYQLLVYPGSRPGSTFNLIIVREWQRPSCSPDSSVPILTVGLPVF